TTPPVSWGAAMAYDPVRRTVVMAAAELGVSGAPAAATWAWNGTDWARADALRSPPARTDHCFVPDALPGSMLVFGGCAEQPLSGGTSAALGDTWRWDGARWQELAVGTGPPARCSHGLACDSARRRVVLFGGITTNSSLFGDTWEWDGS